MFYEKAGREVTGERAEDVTTVSAGVSPTPRQTIESILLVGGDAPFASAITKALSESPLHVVWMPSPSGLAHRFEFRYQRGMTAPVLIVVDLAGGARVGAPEALVAAVRKRFVQTPIVALVTATSEDQARRLFRFGAAPLPKTTTPWTLAALATTLLGAPKSAPLPAPAPDLSTMVPGPSERRRNMDLIVEAYATMRALSRQQLVVFRLYLNGHSDKQIATINGCAEATVYEHWRRMAKKASVSLKSDVIADFHRFLSGG